MEKHELFAKSGGNRVGTHNPKVAGKCPEWVSSPAPAIKKALKECEIRVGTHNPKVVDPSPTPAVKHDTPRI